MSETGSKTRNPFGWANGWRQWLAVFGWSLIVAVAANVGLSSILLAVGLSALLILILGGRRFPLWAAPSFVFLAALVIYSRSLETLQIGTPAWNFRLGGLLVSLWISGLLYILLATLARYVGIRRMRRVFSPAFGGVMVVLLALSLLPRIFSFAYYEPLLVTGTPAYKYILVAVAAFIGYFITTALGKKVGQQPTSAILIGLGGGLIMTLLLDAIELLWLSKLMDQTMMLGLMNASFFADVSLTPFHNLEGSFGFWQYLHFDWESLLLFVPLVPVAVSEHLAAMTRYALMAPETSPHADKTILIEGVAVLVGGMVSGVPLTFNEDAVTIGTRAPKARPLVLIILALFTIAIGVYLPIARVFDMIPLPVIGGVLVAWAGYEAVRGFSRVTERIHDDLHPQATALAMVVLGFGILMTTMEFISDFLGNTSFRLMIGTTPVPSFLIIIVLAFLLNLIFPRLVE